MIVCVLGYLFGMIVVGIIAGFVALDLAHFPKGSEPAVGFLAGVLWPLTLIAACVYGLWRAGRGVVLGFRVLWRHFHPTPVVPSATVHRVGEP